MDAIRRLHSSAPAQGHDECNRDFSTVDDAQLTKGLFLEHSRILRLVSSYGCERLHRAWRFCSMRPVVAIISKQRTQVLSGALRVSIRPETIFHKTGRRCLDCCFALDVRRIWAKIMLGTSKDLIPEIREGLGPQWAAINRPHESRRTSDVIRHSGYSMRCGRGSYQGFVPSAHQKDTAN